MKRKFKLALASAAAVLVATTGQAFAQKTLEAIKARGELVCGVSTGLGGFSVPDSAGQWTGLDVDVCKAIAAAIFGDGSKVKFQALSAQQRFTALQSGEVDLLSRNTTWTLTRDTSLGLNFAGVTYYDGQGFMVPKKLGVKSAIAHKYLRQKPNPNPNNRDVNSGVRARNLSRLFSTCRVSQEIPRYAV